MTCAHCIGADQFFDDKQAKKELKQYLKKGVTNPTKKLVTALKQFDLNSFSLLDIGGGIGAIPLELYKAGIRTTTDVDASEAYLHIQKQEATSRGLIESMHFIKGDYVDVAHEIPTHDIVTLDKVICCYPDVEKLLTLSLEKSKRYYALIYPLDGVIAEIFSVIGILYFKLIKSSFRPYIHSHKKVNKIVLAAGFKKVYEELSFPWKVYVYERGS